jgi:hypothetical protein
MAIGYCGAGLHFGLWNHRWHLVKVFPKGVDDLTANVRVIAVLFWHSNVQNAQQRNVNSESIFSLRVLSGAALLKNYDLGIPGNNH